MNYYIFRGRRWAAAIAILMLTCAAPSHAWCANLWVSVTSGSGGGIESYTPGQLARSGTPTPIHLSTFDSATGIAFDESHNLWAVIDGNKVVRFTAGELTSGGSKSADILLSDDGGCTNLCSPGEIAFDQRGNLWVPNEDANTVVEYAKDQLTSSGKPAPMVTLSSAIFDAP